MIYQILSSRLRNGSRLPFEEDLQKDLTEIHQLSIQSLDLTDSIELSQILIRNSGLTLYQSKEDDPKELASLTMILSRNPAAIVHVVPQLARLSSCSVSELRAIIHHGISLGSYSINGMYGNGIFKEIDDAYHILNNEQRAFIVLFSVFWSEAMPLVKFVEWVTTTSKTCKKTLNSLVLNYFMAKGFLECDGIMGGEDGGSPDPVVSWIHPLLTLYGRRAAYDLLPIVHIQLSQKVAPSGLQTRQSIISFDVNQCQTKAAITLLSVLDLKIKFDQLPKQFSILSVEFKKEVLGWISSTHIARLMSTIAHGFSNNDLHHFWISEAANLATCLSICTRKINGKNVQYIPVKEWPLEYFCLHMANICLVGNPTQVAEFTAYFEVILDIFLTLTMDKPLSPTHQRILLMIANYLVTISTNEVPNLIKWKEHLDTALNIADAVDSKSPKVVYLKALTLRNQSLYLLKTGDGKKALEVWQKMNEMEKFLFINEKGKQPTFGSGLSPERVKEMSCALSTTEGTTEEVSQRLMSLSSNTMLAAFHKSHKQDGKLFEAVATGKYDKMRPNAKRGLIHNIGDGMEGISNGAKKMVWNNLAANRRWWPANFNLHAFIDKFDDEDRRLDALEETMDSGNMAKASDHLILMMMRAFEHFELDDVEEYINALEELARSGVVPELKDIDWKQQKDILGAGNVLIGLVSEKGSKKTVGKGKATLNHVAESIEDQIGILKQQGEPPEMIAHLEASVNSSRASRTAAKTKLEKSVQAAENLITILKKAKAPQKHIDCVKAGIRDLHADQDQQDIKQGVTAESAQALQKFWTALHKMAREDPNQVAHWQKSHFQWQQLQRDLDEAEANDDYELALTRLDTFEDFFKKAENRVFKEGLIKDNLKEKRASLQFLKAALPISEDLTHLLCDGKIEEAKNLIRRFEVSLSPVLRKAG